MEAVIRPGSLPPPRIFSIAKRAFCRRSSINCSRSWAWRDRADDASRLIPTRARQDKFKDGIEASSPQAKAAA